MSDLGAASWTMRFHSTPNIQKYGKSPTGLTAALDLMHHFYYPDYLPKNKELSLAEGKKEYFNKLDKRVHLFEHKVLPHAKKNSI